MGFRDLRVINEDRVAPASGFPMHPHRDMEIITYVMEGALTHKDSLGTGAIIQPGEIQRMSAGTGILHSEFNASSKDPVHLLQIWIFPDKKGGAPSYAQQAFDKKAVLGKFGLLASREGREGSISLQQDADLWLARLSKGEHADFALRKGRGAWAQITKGEVKIGDQTLHAGDGVSWEEEGPAAFSASSDSEILLFDLN
jgi:redox-sensitive bicupin YhaK (pirin superfamily)